MTDSSKTLHVDSASLAGIEHARKSFLRSNDGFIANLTIHAGLTPSGAAVYTPCEVGHACLDMKYLWAANGPAPAPSLVNFPKSPLPAVALPYVDLGDGLTSLALLAPATNASSEEAYELGVYFGKPSVVSLNLLGFGLAGDWNMNPGQRVNGAGDAAIVFPVTVKFPSDFYRDTTCNCADPGVSDFPGCGELCGTLGQAIAPYPVSQCVQHIRTRVSSLQYAVALVPRMRSSGPAIDWTDNFPGSSRLHHAEQGFDVTAVFVGGINYTEGKANDFGAVLSSSEDGLAVIAAASSDCVPCKVADCATDMAAGVAGGVADLLLPQFLEAFNERVASLLNYDGHLFTPTAPKACTPNFDDPHDPCAALIYSDLLPASMTYQKLAWFDGVFSPYGPRHEGLLPVTGVTGVIDFYIEPRFEWEPSSLYFTYDPDQDGDGVPTDADPCPTCADNSDSDGDGVCDCTDPCPHATGTNETHWGDIDGDGVCDDVDNCEQSANPGQEDCNLDAELATSTAVRGDACDPAPCADAATKSEPLSAGKGFATASCAANAPAIVRASCPLVVDSAIDWHGVVAPTEPQGKWGEVQFAHCPCPFPHGDASARYNNCQTVFGGLGLRCALADHELFPTKTNPSPAGQWRATTTTYAPGPFQVDTPSARNHAYPTTFAAQNAPLQSTSWRFDVDYPQWGIAYAPPTGGAALPNDLTPLAQSLDGIGWAATRTFGGTTLSGVAADLANHYFAQDLRARVRTPIGVTRILGPA